MSSPADPSRRGMLYENSYVWLIFVSCLDIMFTWIVLWRGGREANGLAAAIIGRFGIVGIVLFKLAMVLFIIGLCEWIGRRSREAGRKFAKAAVVISAFPVGLAFVLLSK
jgi:hypothetical protein